MPRKAREKSKTGIYHIMIRGINQQQIFQDDEDNEKFLEVLKDYKVACGFELYGYCLMGNHVHLLIRAVNDKLDRIFKKIGARYVYWYNRKYKRSGHLFQDRFLSEPVEDKEYFLAVLRYIHQNPVKATLASTVDGYRWSSYNEYVGKCKLVDTALVSKIMSSEKFEKFNKAENSDCCLEKAIHLNDDDAKGIMRRLFDFDTVEKFQQLDFQERNICINKLREEGISVRQISRLTGFSRGIVERALA